MAQAASFRGVVVATVTAAVLLCGAASATALSGPSGSGDASAAQYRHPVGQGLGAGEAGGAGGAVVQSGVSAHGGLPLTGWVVLPVLLIGVVLLVSGLALRHRSSAFD